MPSGYSEKITLLKSLTKPFFVLISFFIEF
nr:MAG TPA: hypothetical protein [Caudoviricetes sp.]